ncbi:DUF6114 domain-containing protein [Marinactinospora thermotolerans]|uniref:Uncharacterized protein n=1 Tax=Marinactinospora thermotolerans DSM 45154 TaxID=1122192 RepID=A0A1T4RTP9_9ACTN|nr:DUF6114 domain-containing protein [Marinactinospora thermotolerans]SKA19355.1 hypothetical protein SAMN02745673_02977 [Marinactinospora thermotolerans DSM 45154]
MRRHGTAQLRHAPRQGFRTWRRTRPFWGGLLVIVAGLAIVAAPMAPLPLIIHQGIAGVSGYFVGLLLIAIGVLTWLQPAQRFFFGIVAILLSLVSFVTSNFGGFGIGLLTGIVGGSSVFAWGPKEPREHRRRARGSATVPPTGPAEKEPAAEPRGDGTSEERPPIVGSEGQVHGVIAFPLALLLALSAPAWPWDDRFGGGQEGTAEQEATPSPSPSPSVSPSPGSQPSEPPGASPGPGDGGEDDGGDGDEDGGEDGRPEEEDEEGDSEEEAEVAEECQVREGVTDISEEEFRAIIEACEAARERGEVPDFTVHEGDGRFIAHTAPSGLSADRLTMSGAAFGGVVEYPTTDGPRRYLKLTMDEGVFTGAEKWFEEGTVRSTLDIPSMTMEGDVVLHVTRMEVRLLGIPLTFTPDFPPPLLLPYMIVTDVDVEHPLAEADSIVIDGFAQSVGS